MSQKETSFFKVLNLDMNFGAMEALKGINFEVRKKMIFGIAGPNGAGKTTLLNVISGALKPTEGEIYLDGETIGSMKPMTVCHKGIARIFQIPAVFPTLSVFDNIRVGYVFGQSPGKKSAKNLFEIIDFVGLRGKENLLAANIDLYSRKLLMLAAALATGPKVLLLDEPLGGLNFREIDAYLDLVRTLNEDLGITILVVEHLFDKLVQISEEILILYFGKQIYLGPSDRVGEDKKVIEVYLGMKQHA